MAQFVVMQKEDAEKAVFVRDGFSVPALVLPFVWLLAQRLWFEAFAVLGVTILLGLAGSLLGVSGAVPLLSLLVAVFVALEGANWKIARLRRQGFEERAAIDASDLDEAEIRYYLKAVPSENIHAAKPAPAWDGQPPRSTPTPLGPSRFGSTIGFVGHRGEN